jgi:pimeloyl-ACP methyl ester carboxylesterase
MTPKLPKAEIVRRVKNASLIVVPEVKHLLPVEAPEKIADLIREEIENTHLKRQKTYLNLPVRSKS